MNESFNCKICGAPLDVIDSRKTCQCSYCGTKQTVPLLDSDKKKSLFSRAIKLLRDKEFDKASNVYETIVSEFPTEAEAYWGLILCKYGIDYVDDPATKKKIPTCHRTVPTSIFNEKDFQNVLTYADEDAEELYKSEAKQIDKLQKTILDVVKKEKPYDVFICYKENDENGDRTKDSVYAQDIYEKLKEKGFKVFFSKITLEDKLGVEYEPYIYSALKSAKVMLVVGSSEKNLNSVWVKNEWSRFINFMQDDNSKVLIPCYFDIDPYDLPIEFNRFQGVDLTKMGSLQDLVRGIEKIVIVKHNFDEEQIEEIINRTTTEQRKSNKKLITVLSIFIIFAIAVALYFASTREGDTITVDNYKQVTWADDVDMSTINVTQKFDNFPVEVTYGSSIYPSIIYIEDISYELIKTVTEGNGTNAYFSYTVKYDVTDVNQYASGDTSNGNNYVKIDAYVDDVFADTATIIVPNVKGEGTATFNWCVGLKDSERKITWKVNTDDNKKRYQQYYTDNLIFKPKGLNSSGKFSISITNTSKDYLYYLYFNIYVYDKNGNNIGLSAGNTGTINIVDNPLSSGKSKDYTFDLSVLKNDSGEYIFENYEYDETNIIFEFLCYSIDGQSLIEFEEPITVQMN